MKSAAVLALASLPLCASVDIPSVELSNGVKMPVLSYGANLYDESTCKQATGDALQAGFRFVWSSALIGEACQRIQRQAIDESGIPRDEIFLAGTVNTRECSSFEACHKETKSGAEKQLDLLSDSHLDMLMLDYPSGAGCQGILGQWKAFEEMYEAEKVRTIAVSNFGEQELKCLMDSKPSVAPTVNQMSVNAGQKQGTVLADNAKYGITVQAYSPLGSGSLVSDALLQKIGDEHEKSAAQVALKWLLQQGIAPNVASKSREHLDSDLQLNFTLSEAEMQQITDNGKEVALPPMSKFAVEEAKDMGVASAGLGFFGLLPAVLAVVAMGVFGVYLARSYEKQTAQIDHKFAVQEFGYMEA